VGCDVFSLCTSRCPLKMLGHIPPSTQCHIPVHFCRNLTCSSASLILWYTSSNTAPLKVQANSKLKTQYCGGSTPALCLGYSRVIASAADEISWLTAFVDFLSTSNYITTISFYVLSSSLFTVHPLTQCYTFWATNSVNQHSTNKHVGSVIHHVARRIIFSATYESNNYWPCQHPAHPAAVVAVTMCDVAELRAVVCPHPCLVCSDLTLPVPAAAKGHTADKYCTQSW